MSFMFPSSDDADTQLTLMGTILQALEVTGRVPDEQPETDFPHWFTADRIEDFYLEQLGGTPPSRSAAADPTPAVEEPAPAPARPRHHLEPLEDPEPVVSPPAEALPDPVADPVATGTADDPPAAAADEPDEGLSRLTADDYAAWADRMKSKREELQDEVRPDEETPRTLSDEWSPDALFDTGRDAD